MWHILLKKAGMGGIVKLMRRYNSLFKRPAGRRWVLELNVAALQPPSWPSSWRWEGRHDRWWRQMLQAAQRFERRPGRHPCPRANHYGGPVDGEHADDPTPWCWERIDCGETAQAYWRRPKGGCARRLPASVAGGGCPLTQRGGGSP